MRLIIFILFCGITAGYSQDKKNDLQLIESNTPELVYSKWYKTEGNSNKILETKSKSAIAKYNPLSLTLKGLMAGYQHLISPLLHGYCFYELSCSNFAKAAITEFGIIKGTALAADRLTRCNRISATDLHPVQFNPATGKFIDEPHDYKIKK